MEITREQLVKAFDNRMYLSDKEVKLYLKPITFTNLKEANEKFYKEYLDIA